MALELYITHGNTMQAPPVVDGIQWQTERQGTPGKLTFEVVKDANLDFAEGDAVRLSKDGVDVFFGFVFIKSRDKDGIISVTAYDQLRYLKNKDTIVYENKTAGTLITMLAQDFRLRTGTLEDTGYTIPSRIEENTSLFDMVQNALDLTLDNTGEMHVLYDDFGALTLKSIGNMIVPIVIDAQTGENFSYSSSIDDDTYNQIKLTYENEETGKREVYMTMDSANINQWGVLQYYDTLKEGENGVAKAEALIELYNSKTRKLSIDKAFGDVRVRAGCMVVVQLDLGDIIVNNLFLVEKCVHTFGRDEHFMDLTLRGGEFIA